MLKGCWDNQKARRSTRTENERYLELNTQTKILSNFSKMAHFFVRHPKTHVHGLKCEGRELLLLVSSANMSQTSGRQSLKAVLSLSTEKLLWFSPTLQPKYLQPHRGISENSTNWERQLCDDDGTRHYHKAEGRTTSCHNIF